MQYLEAPFAKFEASIQPTEQEIADYYKRNQEAFREPERIKVTYIHYDPLALRPITIRPTRTSRITTTNT